MTKKDIRETLVEATRILGKLTIEIVYAEDALKKTGKNYDQQPIPLRIAHVIFPPASQFLMTLYSFLDKDATPLSKEDTKSLLNIAVEEMRRIKSWMEEIAVTLGYVGLEEHSDEVASLMWKMDELAEKLDE